ncbi:MAG: hypothetical protein AAF585_17265, partial [Verrucomicrobiota bacterium]
MFKALFRNQLGRIQHAPYEYALARIGLAFVALDSTWRIIHTNDEKGLREPHGFASIGAKSAEDLGAIGDFVVWANVSPGVISAWFVLFACLTALYAVGVAPLLTSSGMLVLHIICGTFYMSQGAMHHGQQIVDLALFGQVLASFWAKVMYRESIGLLAPDSQRHRDLSMFFIPQMIAASYVITGLTKLEKSDGMWILRSPNFAIQFEKNRLMAYHNDLQPVDDALNQWMIDFLVNYSWLGILMFGFVLFLEFGAFLALFNRILLLLFGISIVAMHINIGMIMKLHFPNNQWLVFIFFVNAPFWILF